MLSMRGRLGNRKQQKNRQGHRWARSSNLAFCERLEDRRLLSVSPFTPGDLAVVRIGGVAGDPAPQTNSALAAAPATVFIDEYTPAGVFVQSVQLTVSTVSPSDPASLVAAGTDFTFANITRTLDGQHLLVPGYWKSIDAPGNPSSDSSLATPRVIGLVDQNGNLDTSTRLTDAYSGGAAISTIRSVASVNGSSFYTTGANDTNGGATGGLHYVAHLGDSTSVNLSQNVGGGDNLRQAQIINGKLFITSHATVPGHTIFGVRLRIVDDKPGRDLQRVVSRTSFELFRECVSIL
jgi:hypothetical protein